MLPHISAAGYTPNISQPSHRHEICPKHLTELNTAQSTVAALIEKIAKTHFEAADGDTYRIFVQKSKISLQFIGANQQTVKTGELTKGADGIWTGSVDGKQLTSIGDKKALELSEDALKIIQDIKAIWLRCAANTVTDLPIDPSKQQHDVASPSVREEVSISAKSPLPKFDLSRTSSLPPPSLRTSQALATEIPKSLSAIKEELSDLKNQLAEIKSQIALLLEVKEKSPQQEPVSDIAQTQIDSDKITALVHQQSQAIESIHRLTNELERGRLQFQLTVEANEDLKNQLAALENQFLAYKLEVEEIPNNIEAQAEQAIRLIESLSNS